MRKGVIYFDTDFELTKSIDDLLVNRAFFCSENEAVINTGLGFGAEPGMECVRRMMEDYDHATFVYKREDGNKALLDMTTCPVRNTKALPYLIGDTQNFNIAYSLDGILFLPRDWFCPFKEDFHYIMDLELWYRLVAHDEYMYRIPGYTWAMRIHEDSKTTGRFAQDTEAYRRHEENNSERTESSSDHVS